MAYKTSTIQEQEHHHLNKESTGKNIVVNFIKDESESQKNRNMIIRTSKESLRCMEGKDPVGA